MTVEPYDEPEITNEDIIIRRINPEHHIIYDKNLKCKRISTKAFSASSGKKGGMSVDILALIEADGHVATEYVTTPVYIGSVKFTAGVARRVGLQVGYVPINGNPYHGEVWKVNGSNRFGKSQQKALITASEWFVEIPNVRIS